MYLCQLTADRLHPFVMMHDSSVGSPLFHFSCIYIVVWRPCLCRCFEYLLMRKARIFANTKGIRVFILQMADVY